MKNKDPSPKTVRAVCAVLKKTYGVPRLGNPAEPLDDLIFIVLSNKTAANTAKQVFDQLQLRFPDWEMLIAAPAHVTKRILRPAGLSVIKTRYIRAALRQIRNDFSKCNLEALRTLSTSDAESYLSSLPGVSTKVAKCVVMYTLNGQVFPVDSHAHRILARLGWTQNKRADRCHDELESLIPSKLRHALHVDLIVHGRLICRPTMPLCKQCCMRQYCNYFKGID